MFIVLPERPGDEAAIENLLDNAFGPERHNKASYAFRQDFPAVPGLSLCALSGEKLVGTIRLWPITVGDGATPTLLLGPLGVAPERRNYGIGRGLIYRGHMIAQELGYKLVLLVGEEKYYRRFGYKPAQPHGVSMPGEVPSRLLVHEIVPGALHDVAGEIQAGDCLRSGVVKEGLTLQARY